MNGFCDWCEEIATMKRGDDDICDACDERLEHEAADEWERSLSPEQCRAWQRARDAGVD